MDVQGDGPNIVLAPIAMLWQIYSLLPNTILRNVAFLSTGLACLLGAVHLLVARLAAVVANDASISDHLFTFGLPWTVLRKVTHFFADVASDVLGLVRLRALLGEMAKTLAPMALALWALVAAVVVNLVTDLASDSAFERKMSFPSAKLQT
jgi:hypothetical protein